MTDNDNFVNKLEEIVWKKMIENVRDLGQILIRPEDYSDATIKNRLNGANCTASWALLFKDNEIIISDLIQDGHDLITYLYDLVKDKRYTDGRDLIRATELDKIIKPDSSLKFPEDLIPIFETILRNYFKSYYLIR